MLRLDHEGTDGADEILFRAPMLDQRDYGVGPSRRVLNREVVTICVEKLHHRDEASTLVSLSERMRLRDTRQQPDSECNDILVAIGKSVLRACQGAIQQPSVAKKMRLPGYRDNRPIDLDDCLDRQPLRLIWQVLRGYWGSGP